MATVNAPAPPVRRAPAPYVPAVAPHLRVLLMFIFFMVAVLGASGIYLFALRALEWYQNQQDQTLQTPFSLWMMLVHVGVGIILVIPFLYFGITHMVTARHRPNRVA